MLKKIAHNIRYKVDPAIRITTIYVFFSFLWILFSDTILEWMVDDISAITKIQIAKGWFFVSMSGVVIYILISRSIADLKKVRKSLDTALEFHKTLFDEFPQPIYQVSPEGKVVFMNSKCKEVPGLNKQHLFDNTWLKHVHPDDQGVVLERYRKALLSEDKYSFEFRIKTINGSYRYYLDSGIPFYSSTGQIKGFISTCVDINEKKEFEKQLKDALGLYSNLFLNNPNPMFVIDNESFNIIEANESASHLYGYAKDQFSEMNFKDLISQDCIDIKQKEDLLNSCRIHKKNNGEEIRVELSFHSLPKYKGKEGHIVSVQDITESKKAFDNLFESEQRFKTLFKSSPNVNFILSKHYAVIDVNQAACNFLMLEPEVIINKSIHDLFGGNFNDFFLDFFEEVKNQTFWQNTVSKEFNENKDFSAEVFCMIFKEKGEERYYFSLKDVSDRVRISKALKESERQLNSILDNLPGMVYRCKNDPHYTMEYVSVGALKLTGYTPMQIENNNEISFGEIIHPEDRKRIWEEIQDNIYSRKTVPLIYRIVSTNKSIKWVLNQVKGVFSDDGELLLLEGFINDITEEKNSQEALVFQSNLMRSIIDNIPFPVFYKNMQGRYIGCNREFCEYLGLSEDDIIGKTVFDVFSKDQAKIFYEKDKSLFDSLSTQVYETEINYKNGKRIDALFFKSVFFDTEKNPQGIVGVYLVISDRVKAERTINEQMKELSRINSELERFTYTVSHDLRSPLVTIQGFLGLIKESAEKGDIVQMEEDMSRIEKATEKMHYLLEDLLQLSRIGRTTGDFAKFPMSKLVQEICALLDGRIKNSNAKIYIEPNMPDAYGDRSRIGEVWQNLIENAVKFCGKDNPEISLGSYTDEKNRQLFFIQDNGVGIEKQFHDKIFGLFNKLDPKTEGTGVGLSIVKRIIEIHEGEIWCESDGKGKGTRFVFSLGGKMNMVKN
ncbi:MAG: PAS domain S-box protein [Bacteroidetes bacterium]|nr:PAS domain S-box protein [Bacteroidota bacterium]